MRYIIVPKTAPITTEIMKQTIDPVAIKRKNRLQYVM